MEIEIDEAKARGQYLSKAARAQGQSLDRWVGASLARWFPVEPDGFNLWSVETDDGTKQRMVALVGESLVLGEWDNAESQTAEDVTVGVSVVGLDAVCALEVTPNPHWHLYYVYDYGFEDIEGVARVRFVEALDVFGDVVPLSPKDAVYEFDELALAKALALRLSGLNESNWASGGK